MKTLNNQLLPCNSYELSYEDKKMPRIMTWKLLNNIAIIWFTLKIPMLKYSFENIFRIDLPISYFIEQKNLWSTYS